MTEQHSYNTQYFLSRWLYFGTPAARSISRRSQITFSLAKGAPSQLPRPPLKSLCELFAENSIIRVPHPPCSPDLAPSDFWLFEHMKAVLAGQQFPGPYDILIGIQEFLTEIQRSELDFVFHRWIERV
jgi:hypothetical protein